MTRDELYKLLCDTALELTEHCDSVQIIATTYDTEGTGYVAAGNGNWYARQGSCRSFLERDFATESARLIANEIKAKEED